jgi:hypothetical protein
MPVSVEFEPVRLEPRRRRADPVLLGALVVAIAVVAAVLKPWSWTETSSSEGTDAAIAPASAAPSGPVSPSPRDSLADLPLASILTGDLTTAVNWNNIRPAVRRHDEWGIRAIVVASARSTSAATARFVERWYPIPDSSADPGELPTVDLDFNDRTVVALGLTFRRDQMPLDARIWQSFPGRLDWVDSEPVDPEPAGGGFLYQPFGPDGPAPAWNAGSYRIDVLVAGGVRRFGVTIPSRFSVAPAEAGEPPRSPSELAAPALFSVADLPVGLFAISEGAVLRLAADPRAGLDEASAWLNVDPGTGRAPRSDVATKYLPNAIALGVVLPRGSTVEETTIGRLAPDNRFQGHPNVIVSGGLAGASYVEFDAPDGGVWRPGVYRISVIWVDEAGRAQLGSWHVELRPGPVRDTPRALLAARSFARYAGESGVVVGTAEPDPGTPDAITIRLLRSDPSGPSGFPLRDQVACNGVRVDGLAGIVGVAHPVDRPPSRVTARVLYEFSRSEEQPILTAAGDMPGLTLVAPIGDVAPVSSAYRFRIGDDPRIAGTTVCLWTAPVG